MSQNRKERILGVVGDLALNFVVYDRKEDEDLPRGEIEDAIDLGEVTLEEILDAFKDRFLKERRQPRVFLSHKPGTLGWVPPPMGETAGIEPLYQETYLRRRSAVGEEVAPPPGRDPYERSVLLTLGENPPEMDVYELLRKQREAGRPFHGGPTYREENEKVFNRLIQLGLIRVGERMGTLALTAEGLEVSCGGS